MKDKNYKLKFEFERFNGETAYAEYKLVKTFQKNISLWNFPQKSIF